MASNSRRPTLSEPGAAERAGTLSLVELAQIVGLIALTGFGGGQKAQVRRQFVSRLNLLSEQEFLEALEVSELLPGPNIINLTVFIGQRLCGPWGGTVALIAGATPPFAIVLLAGAFYFSTFNTPIVHAALSGAAAAALGLTIANAWELTQNTAAHPTNLIFVVATAIVVSMFHVPLALTLLFLGGLSIAWSALRARRLSEANQ